MSRFMSFTSTALKNLFSKPATTAYPAVPKEYPERTRGHIEIDIDECILCGLCMRTCPPGAITVDRPANTWTIQKFDCVQCGYCVDKCPKKCLHIVPGYTQPGPVKEPEVHIKPVEEKAESSASGGKLPHADLDACVYCTLCAKKCPQEAITVNREDKTWKLDEEKCVGCELCATSCPKKCIEMK